MSNPVAGDAAAANTAADSTVSAGTVVSSAGVSGRGVSGRGVSGTGVSITGASSTGDVASAGGSVPDLNPDLALRLSVSGLDPGAVRSFVVAALAEDLAGGIDVTTAATVPPAERGRADLVSRAPGVVAGLPIAEAVFWLVSADVQCSAIAADGDPVGAGHSLLTVSGPVGPILTAERTALNLLCHLYGVATLTRRWVDEVAGTGARIRDTRKTLPGMRALEKYAVRCGGGVNHRMSLSDAALIKDNHVAAAGSVGAAFAAVRAYAPGLPLEVECDTLDQVAEALAAGADLILLDNFDVPGLEAAVRLADGRALLEASGGLTLASARSVAQTGVDYLAVGALTHSAPALDIGLDLVQAS
jgi:nicotinate-nucleotide pyrophosphorylase (carboxylating)